MSPAALIALLFIGGLTLAVVSLWGYLLFDVIRYRWRWIRYHWR